jgi:DNA-binding protein H-NS
MNESVNPTDTQLSNPGEHSNDRREHHDHPDHPDQIERKARASSPASKDKSSIFPFLGTVGYEVDDFGRHLVEPHSDFDGFDAISSSAKALGSVLQLGAAIGTHLEEKNQQTRVENAIEKIGELDQRINKLHKQEPIDERERRIPRPILANSKRDVPEPVASLEPPPQGEASPPTVDAFGKSLQQIDQRLKKLEKRDISIPQHAPLPKIDPKLSINQKLALIETALNQLSDRVDKLEQVAAQRQAQQQAQQPKISPEEPVEEAAEEQAQQPKTDRALETIPKVAGGAIAQSLQNFVEARAKYLDKSPEEAVVTTMGRLTLSQEDGKSAISLKSDRYDDKFAATLTEDGWRTTRNDLTADESQRILNLPQSPEDYQSRSVTRTLIAEMKQAYPEKFNQEDGVLKWKLPIEGQEAIYTMSIHLNPDQSRNITVNQQLNGEEKTVMLAKVNPDQSIDVSHSELNPEVTQSQSQFLRNERLQASTQDNQVEL